MSTQMKQLPAKTVERLSRYRRVLTEYMPKNKHRVFSHEIAKLLHVTPEQVRRDLMLMGHSSTLKKGYDISDLITQIDSVFSNEGKLKMAMIGMGNLGKAITAYLSMKRRNIEITATFDIEYDKINRVISGVRCYHIDRMNDIIREKNISIAILTLPAKSAATVANKLIIAGIKGILNYTTCPISVPENVYLEENDMITSIEKIAYFTKFQS